MSEYKYAFVGVYVEFPPDTEKKTKIKIKMDIQEIKKNYIKEKFKTKIKESLNEAPEKYSHIDFKPPESVANNAAKGLEYRKKGGGGGLTNKQASKEGIGSGVQRATNLKNRNTVSPKVINQMVSFFARHEKNKSVDKGKKPWEDNGFVSHLLWGGDAGKSWAEKIKKQMEVADKKKKNEVTNYIKSLIIENYYFTDQRNPAPMMPDTIFSMFKSVQIKAHYNHLKSDSYAEHKALGRFYEKLDDILDELMEISLAYNKDFFKHDGNIRFMPEQSSQHCLEMFNSYLLTCKEYVSDGDLLDVLVQASKLTKQTLYLLTLR